MKCRVSKAHVWVYRAVEGAVYNTAVGHPSWRLTKDMARSIAKRATGTLTASWPDVLAARSKPSDPADDPEQCGHWPPRRRGRVGRKGGHPAATVPPNYRKLWKHLSIQVGKAKRAKQTERAEALIEILKFISKPT